MDHRELNGLGPALFETLRPGETVQIVVQVDGATLIVTTERVAVGVDRRIEFNLRIAGIRRLQFEVETQRPAALTIVPESAHVEPEILAVMPHAFGDVGRAMEYVGHRLEELSRGRSSRGDRIASSSAG